MGVPETTDFMIDRTDPVTNSSSDAPADTASSSSTLSWLFDEFDRLRRILRRVNEERRTLRAEREALLQENRRLRREATLVRLYQDLGARRDASGSGVEAPPASAATLYRELPATFTFADFFHQADVEDVDTDAARSCLRYFLRTDMLAQKGSRLEKTGQLLRAVPTSDAEVTVHPSSRASVENRGRGTSSEREGHSLSES